ncbi:MAG: CusA/CzcA family heavy metal efflux RND transporter [Legionellales bacterium]|nr:CusA/CzcA family heavy metal efflux RND transporter [Legionellales bacterium]
MLSSIVKISVHNRVIITLITFSLMVAAWFILPSLNLDAFPDVTNIQVQVNTEAPGLAAEEVEKLITYPIEAEMYSLRDVKEVRSISKTGLSGITVVFDDAVDIYFARQQVFQQLQSAKEQIPSGVGTPEIGPNTSGLGQIYQYILKSKSGEYTSKQLRSLNDWVVKLLLLPIPGVTDVLSFGGDVLQYQVQLIPDQMISYDITIDDVVSAIEHNNSNSGGWYINRGQEQLVVRGEGWLPAGDDGIAALKSIPLKTVHGTPIYIGDLANVNYGSEIRQGAVTISQRTDNGVSLPEEVVTGIVLKRMGANTNTTIEDIKSNLPIVQSTLPSDVEIETIYDQSSLINKAISTVTNALIQAFIFIFIVLFLFIINIRATLLVIASIPISICLALIMMSYWGISANLMSLGGLAIVIGMLVDGTVVIVDNLFKKMSSAGSDCSMKELVLQSCVEVIKPVFFSILIIVIVFSPLFTLEGVEGKLFQPMAISIVLALIFSLLTVLLSVPAAASLIFSSHFTPKEPEYFKRIENTYAHLLDLAMRMPQKVLMSMAVLFIVSMASVPFIGSEFVPELEEGNLNIRVTLAPSSNLDNSLALAQKMEKELMKFPEITYASSRVGRPELGGDPEPVSNIEILIGLKPIAEWQTASNRLELQDKLNESLSRFPGVRLSFSQPIATRVDELLSGVKAQLAIKLLGPDLSMLEKHGKEIERAVKGIEGIRDVAMEQMSGESQLVVRPKREQLKRHGMSVSQVMDLVQSGIGGVEAGQIIQGNERYDIYVKISEDYKDSVDKIRNLPLRADSGALIDLKEVADINIETGPPQIRRDNVQRRVVIQANIENRDMGSVVKDINSTIANSIDLPPGYAIDIGGQFENQKRAQARLTIVVPISIALIFILLFFAFHSVTQSLIIMLNVPFALIGGVFALFITGQYLSVPSSIGFIALFGIAILNGVVLVSEINSNIDQGLGTHPSISTAAISRLRPVLMTALTSALGLIPLLYAQGIGSEIQRPLATVVVGGLISSTLLTLFVLPNAYLYCYRQRKEL